MNRPANIVRDILNILGVDDASSRERQTIAKIIYKTQVDAFTTALRDFIPYTERKRKWFETTRKYRLNGSQLE